MHGFGKILKFVPVRILVTQHGFEALDSRLGILLVSALMHRKLLEDLERSVERRTEFFHLLDAALRRQDLRLTVQVLRELLLNVDLAREVG